MQKIILVAGATGHLGLKIVKALRNKNVEIRALVRLNSSNEKIQELERLGATIYSVKQWDLEELKNSCLGVSCVVSSLAGLREVVVDAQKVLLDAAISAGVT